VDSYVAYYKNTANDGMHAGNARRNGASLEKREANQEKVETKTEACSVGMEANQEKLEDTDMRQIRKKQRP
jgi:hypothetical protein